MRHNFFFAAIGAVLCTAPGHATAQEPEVEFRAQSPEVIVRGPDGRAQVVRVEGREYPVCENEQQDQCIQPRAARLGWGDWPAKSYRGDRRFAPQQQRQQQSKDPMRPN